MEQSSNPFDRMILLQEKLCGEYEAEIKALREIIAEKEETIQTLEEIVKTQKELIKEMKKRL